MATFLASAAFSRCPVGYLTCQKTRDTIRLDNASHYPDLSLDPRVELRLGSHRNEGFSQVNAGMGVLPRTI